MSSSEALQIAEDRGYDLIEVNPKASPPVCRLLDYGKYLYEQKKQKKTQFKVTTKELRMRPKIGIHDINTKVRHGRRFIGKGHKVMLTMVLKGRERAFPGRATEILLDVADMLADVAKVESSPKLSQNRISMLLGPA